jgi:hypothetical protein
MRELKPDELRAGCNPAVRPFKSTEEPAPLEAAVERALAENVERLKALRTNSHGEAATRSGSG